MKYPVVSDIVSPLFAKTYATMMVVQELKSIFLDAEGMQEN